MMPGSRNEQQNAIDLLLRKDSCHVHLVGICGVGMAGLAALLQARGLNVTGCDAAPGALCEWLASRGIEVTAGHDLAHLTSDVDWLVHTPAVDVQAPEIEQARQRSIPVSVRGAVLARLLPGQFSVAVCGAHGKTTTATFIGTLLKQAGRDPSWCIGGEAAALGGVAGAGDGGIIVVEADESDGTLELYEPDVAVVTSIEFDHMEHFDGEQAFEECFRRVVEQTERTVVFCNDDPHARRLCAGLADALPYGLSPGSRVTAVDLVEEPDSSSFELLYDGESQGRMSLPVAGRHNVLNALAAVAAAREAGLNADDVRAGISQLRLPRRRFEPVIDGDGIRVVSDYAHHPSEIAALLKTAAAAGPKRILTVFQPHRFTRTLALGRDFPEAFRGADRVVLTPVYAASESPLAGGTTWDLYQWFRRQQDEWPAGRPEVMVADSRRQAWSYLLTCLLPGDLLLIVGAGDVVEIADWARQDTGRKAWTTAADLEDLSARLTSTRLCGNEPLADKTTLRVGGTADLWAEVGTRQDLAVLAAWAAARKLPLNILGNASNVLIGDLGLRGLTLRLTGDFKTIRVEQDEIVAAAAGSCRHLLDCFEKRGLAGLEFLEGIPGTVGGMLRMNAGASGRGILDYVSWIRCLNPDGTQCIVPQRELEYGYRCCGSLRGRIVLEAGFALGTGESREIRDRRKAEADRRRWMRGLRCAGSVFKNPEGDFAGRLIERAGLKGATVGRAAVTRRHANVIVTTEGATASDVRALIEKMRSEVQNCCGVELETEVVLLS